MPDLNRPGLLKRVAGLTLLCLAVAGCGGEPGPTLAPKLPLQPVKGKVVLPDGSPLTEGEINFIPVKIDGRAALSKIGSDGTFSLKTHEEEGAQEGEYKVKIESALRTPGPKSKTIVPIEYMDEDASQLKITVKSGPNDLPPIKLVPVPKLQKSSNNRD